MKFNIFTPFNFIVTTVNFSVDYIQHDRFKEERIRSRTARMCYGDPTRRDSNQPVSSILANIKWMLDYNKDRLRFLVIVVIHLSLLSYQVLKCAIYMSLSNARDDVSNEFVNSTRKKLEANYFIDMFHNYKRCCTLNRVGLLLFSQFLILRLRCLHKRYQTALENRYKYKRLNVVQMHMSTAENFYATYKGWSELIRSSATSKCDHNNERARRQKVLMKRLNANLRHCGKIDKVYYYNQIDFDACFEHKYYFRIYPPENSKQQGRPATKGWARLHDKVSSLMSFKQPDDRLHVAFPIYRAEPFDWFILVAVYLFAMAFMVTVLVSTIIHMWLKELAVSQVSLVDLNFDLIARKMKANPKSMVTMVEICLTFVIVAFNVFDNAVLAYSSMLCHSRVNKLIKSLRTQVDFHRAYLKSFCLFLDQHQFHNEKSSESSELRPHGGCQIDGLQGTNLGTPEIESPSSFQRPELELNRLIEKFVISLQSKDSKSTASKLSQASETVGVAIDEASHIGHVIDHFRVHVNKSALDEFNDDLMYLIDLIYVVVTELNDLKSYFTFYLNLNILFGAAGSAFTFAILVDQSTKDDLVLIILVSFINIVPLINALFMAASSEGSVSTNLLVFGQAVHDTLNEH